MLLGPSKAVLAGEIEPPDDEPPGDDDHDGADANGSREHKHGTRQADRPLGSPEQLAD